jgi:Icc-related predicted phosphoesterase
VKFTESVSQQRVEEIYEKFNLVVVKITERFELVSVPGESDPLEVANIIQESKVANFSCPDFYSKAEVLP